MSVPDCPPQNILSLGKEKKKKKKKDDNKQVLSSRSFKIANAWFDSGFLYGYDTSDCSSETLGKLSTSDSECWAIDDFNGKGWGQVVRGIKRDMEGM